MKQHVFQKQFLALPPYLGGKRRLVPWIFNSLEQAVPKADWPQMTFLDAFVGGGSVSLYAKFQGFRQLHCNDWSQRSQFIIQGLLANQSIRLSREDVLRLTQETETPGFVETNACPDVFSTRHARALDRMLDGVAQFHNPTRQALGKLLIWHLIRDFVCISSSIGSSNRPYAETLDGLRDWQDLNPKRFVDDSFARLLKPAWHSLEKHRQAINAGIFRGSPVERYQMDAIQFVSQNSGDILYLDPPYPGCLRSCRQR